MIKVSLTGKNEMMAKLREKLGAKALEHTRSEARKLASHLATVTPVDTGEAQQGWDVVNTLKGADVTNNVEHIGYLNEGSSKQAPAHFVESVSLQYGVPSGHIVDNTPI